jgi:hypothetical protein
MKSPVYGGSAYFHDLLIDERDGRQGLSARGGALTEHIVDGRLSQKECVRQKVYSLPSKVN